LISTLSFTYNYLYVKQLIFSEIFKTTTLQIFLPSHFIIRYIPVSVEVHIRERKWGWIGHTLWKPNNDLTREALEWNPQGVRRRGHPRMTWRRMIQQEINRMGKSLKAVKELSRNRVRWRNFMEALCSI
jgi:hypothetical protein